MHSVFYLDVTLIGIVIGVFRKIVLQALGEQQSMFESHQKDSRYYISAGLLMTMFEKQQTRFSDNWL